MEPNIDRSMWGIGVLIIAVVVGVLAKDKIYAAVDGIFNKHGEAISGFDVGKLTGGTGSQGNTPVEEEELITNYVEMDSNNGQMTTFRQSHVDKLLERLATENGVQPSEISLKISDVEYTGATFDIPRDSQDLTETTVVYSYTVKGETKNGLLMLAQHETTSGINGVSGHRQDLTNLRFRGDHFEDHPDNQAISTKIVNTNEEGKAYVKRFKEFLQQFGFIDANGQVIENFEVTPSGDEVFDLPNLVGTINVDYQLKGKTADGTTRTILIRTYLIKNLAGTDLELQDHYLQKNPLQGTKREEYRLDVDTLNYYKEGDGSYSGSLFKHSFYKGNSSIFAFKNQNINVESFKKVYTRTSNTDLLEGNFHEQNSVYAQDMSSNLTSNQKTSLFYGHPLGISGWFWVFGVFEVEINGTVYNYAEYYRPTNDEYNHVVSNTVNRFKTIRETNLAYDETMEYDAFTQDKLKFLLTTSKFQITDSLTGEKHYISNIVNNYEIVDLDTSSDEIAIIAPGSYGTERIALIKFNDTDLIDQSKATKQGNTDHYVPIFIMMEDYSPGVDW